MASASSRHLSILRGLSVSCVLACCLAPTGCSASSDGDVVDDAGVPDAGSAGDVRFVGDPSLPPEGELVVFDPVAPRTHDEAVALPMQFGIQGGYMILVAARVRNMDIGTLQITGSVNDDCFTTPRAIGRTSNPMFAQEVDGWGVPDPVQGIASYLNLQLCPNLDSTRDADGHPYELVVRVIDRARRSLELTTRFTATCDAADGPGQAACECQCDNNATLGDVCANLDLTDATDPDVGECSAATRN